jgi:hypothetical protein
VRVIVDDQRGKQPADIPGRGYLAREACAEPRLPGQFRPDNLYRHQPAASRAAQEHLPHPASA